MPTIPNQCRHLFTDGHQCGSAALRGTPLCFHHTAGRQPIPFKKLDGQTVPQLPAPDDYYAIQRAIGEVLRLLANDEITDRRAVTLLRGLSIASQNLARAHRREKANPTLPVTDLTVHPTLGTLALEPVPAPEPETPAIQNQYLSPSRENNFTTPVPETVLAPVPTPVHNFTPHPDFTAADEARVGELYQQLQATFLKRHREFEARKSAELHAEFEDRYDARVAEYEARYRHQQALLLQNSAQQNQDLGTSEETSPDFHPALLPPGCPTFADSFTAG